jgi:chromate transporter
VCSSDLLIFSGATLIAQAAAFGLFGWAVVAATLFANLRTRLHPLWFIAIGGLLGGLTVLF